MTVSNFTSASPASATSFDLAFPSSTVAGSTLLAGIRTGSSLTVTAALVSGSSLTALGPFDNGAGRQYLFYLQNGPGGAQTVRFTMSASGAPRLCVAEITDATATSFDVSTNNSGTGTALTGGATATTAQAAEEAIGLFSIAANETFTQNGSYAVVGVEPAAGSSRLALVHQTLSATGTPNAAVDANASAAWIGQTATFRIAGGGATAHAPAPYQRPLRIWRIRRHHREQDLHGPIFRDSCGGERRLRSGGAAAGRRQADPLTGIATRAGRDRGLR